MNYKQLVELAEKEKSDKENDKFYQNFLDTVKKCQISVEALKTSEEKDGWKTVVRDHVETLKCFMGCIKSSKQSLPDRYRSETGFDGDVIDHNGNYSICYVEWLEDQLGVIR